MKDDDPVPGNSKNHEFLPEERNIYDQVMNNSRSMISIINRDYIYEKVNSAFCREHQVVNNAVVGRSLADVWGEDTFRGSIKGRIDKCFSGETVRYEALFDTPSRGPRYYEVVFRPISFRENRITHLMAETFDIHELRISRQKALDQEAQMRQFETNIPIGFLRCTPDGMIIHANSVFLRIMECPDDISVTELNIRRFYPVEVLFDIQVEQLIESHSRSFGRVFLRNMKGGDIACRLSGFVAFDQSGSPAYIDIAIEDSTRELMLENKLLQAQRLETIGALAGGIAHDFNNILATISGYSEMMLGDLPHGSELAENVNRILGAVQKAHSIINQILTFSRHLEQEKIPVNVAEVLGETIGFIKSSIPSNISVRTRIQNRDANVLADPTQLFRVFLNLMTNSIQSMEDHGGTLTVRMEVAEGRQLKHLLNKDIVADEYVMLTFADTGKGMEQSVVERIFEPFFTTREVGKGTGLGLSVIHGIIRELEGEILVSSREEVGSDFDVYLPVVKDYTPAAGNSGNMKKILFITGNRHESRVLSIALERSGYELLYVTDRADLLRRMNPEKSPPDLIIYMIDSRKVSPEDLIMVFRQLKIETPCILITDDNNSGIEEKLLNSGIIKQHLVRPVSLKEIRNAIGISLGHL